jgi:hypothetical protein
VGRRGLRGAHELHHHRARGAVSLHHTTPHHTNPLGRSPYIKPNIRFPVLVKEYPRRSLVGGEGAHVDRVHSKLMPGRATFD